MKVFFVHGTSGGKPGQRKDKQMDNALEPYIAKFKFCLPGAIAAHQLPTKPGTDGKHHLHRLSAVPAFRPALLLCVMTMH